MSKLCVMFYTWYSSCVKMIYSVQLSFERILGDSNSISSRCCVDSFCLRLILHWTVSVWFRTIYNCWCFYCSRNFCFVLFFIQQCVTLSSIIPLCRYWDLIKKMYCTEFLFNYDDDIMQHQLRSCIIKANITEKDFKY